MRNLLYKLVTDQASNSITYSKNYRIFKLEEPVRQLVQVASINELVDLNGNDPQDLSKKFRWSKDGRDWSLWLDPSEMGTQFLGDEQPLAFFEFKYTYDNGTFNGIQPIVIEEIQLLVSSNADSPETMMQPIAGLTEGSPVVIGDREASFNPYGVDQAATISRELSFQTNKIFGHEVVYFKTEPDRTSGDFIFKEWTLYKTTNRKCIKIMVPDNIFPDSKPVFNEFGVDFEVPFEIHIDHTYFQSIFGADTQPRKRDYLYLPITNRMYEIQGSYLHRGFMMEPIYWKVQLTKFQPNIDMLIEDSGIEQSLNDVIMTTDELFGESAAEQTKDALMKQQYKTISKRFDEVRERVHPNLRNKILDLTYNYAPLIEHYYDMSLIQPTLQTYSQLTTGTKVDQYYDPASPGKWIAYEDSEIFADWLNGRLNYGDTNYLSATNVTLRIDGPKDSFTPLGRYVQIEGYKAIGSETRKQLAIASPAGTMSVKKSETSVIYHAKQSVEDHRNVTFMGLFKFNQGFTGSPIFRAIDNNNGSGLTVSGVIWNDAGTEKLRIVVIINGINHTFETGPVNRDRWYSIIVPISNDFKQVGVTRYSFDQDQANIKNYNRLVQNYSNKLPLSSQMISSMANYALLSGDFCAANIRLFNTVVHEEDHDFLISQLYIRDESMLVLIDNCKPQLNVPFIAINR